jgi:hypothetical protein
MEGPACSKGLRVGINARKAALAHKHKANRIQ